MFQWQRVCVFPTLYAPEKDAYNTLSLLSSKITNQSNDHKFTLEKEKKIIKSKKRTKNFKGENTIQKTFGSSFLFVRNLCVLFFYFYTKNPKKQFVCCTKRKINSQNEKKSTHKKGSKRV